MSKINKFWMVKGEGPTNVRHFSREDAEREADRLACENPGFPFFVLEAVSRHRKVDVERIDLRGKADAEDDQIPF